MSDSIAVHLKINGTTVEVPAGTVVIEAARQAGVDIPYFCYHPRLSMEAGANCRMCLVDVAMPRRNPDGSVVMAKMPKPQASCSLPVSEGMEIETESPGIVADRKGVLEFLLINHPLDCPICDRGGECPLQNNVLHYGPPTSRFIEEKRHFPKAYPLSDHVVFDRERCIHCARCTRFTTDISGDSQLGFLFRGAGMEVATHNETAFQSKFSGNVIELCPVGALLSRDYRFKARPWDLMTQKSLCTQCSNGCNIKLDYRVGKLQRVNARLNEAVNEEWTCDRGKFGMGYVSSEDRLTQPLVRRDGKLETASWEEANRLISDKLRAAANSTGAIGGAHASNEDVYVWQKFLRQAAGTSNLDHRMGPNFPAASSGEFARFGYRSMGNSIADLERMKTILVFGSHLADEQPIVFLRVRKAWCFGEASVVEVAAREGNEEAQSNSVREFASVSLRYKPGTELPLLAAIVREALGGKAGKAVGDWSAESAAKVADVDPEAIRKAAALLGGEGLAVVAGEAVRHSPDLVALQDLLFMLLATTGNPGNYNQPVSEMNAQGAASLGMLPDALPGYSEVANPGMNTAQMLDAAAKGRLDALWIHGEDLLSRFSDPGLARRAMERCPFTVVSDLFLTETAKAADVVLPASSIAEYEGTLTNCERRVQRFWKAFEPVGESRPLWLIVSHLGLEFGAFAPYFSANEIAREIADRVAIYAGCSLEALQDEGVRWGVPETEAVGA